MASEAFAGRESKSSTKTRTSVSGRTSVTARVRGETSSRRRANGSGDGFRRAQVGLFDAGNDGAGGKRNKSVDVALRRLGCVAAAARGGTRSSEHALRRDFNGSGRTAAGLA